MYDHELTKLQNELQTCMLKVNELQAKHRELTGRQFVISGPRPKIETRDCVYINYEGPEPEGDHSISSSSWMEFEGDGVGGVAVADYLNHGAHAYDKYFTEHVVEAYENAMALEAEVVAADRGNWEYEKAKDRRTFPPLQDAEFKGE